MVPALEVLLGWECVGVLLLWGVMQASGPCCQRWHSPGLSVLGPLQPTVASYPMVLLNTSQGLDLPKQAIPRGLAALGT